MPGRNAKPIQLHLQNGNKRHLTKAEIEQRKNSEIKTGSKELLCPAYVKIDIAAFSKWREIKHIYKDVDFVSSGDVGLLGRYCMTFSEYLKLLERMKRIGGIHNSSDNIEDYINDSEEFDFRIKKQLLDIVSTDGILKLETAINKKQDLLLKMEDRLFLNPLAKIKNVPKEKKQETEDPNAEMFGD